MRRSAGRGPRGLAVAALALAAAALRAMPVSAAGELAAERSTFLSLAVGPAFNYESWSPDGASQGASYTGWAPALDVAVGRQVRRGLVLAGELQLAMIVNRTESYLGASYPLSDTLHFVDVLGPMVDYTPWSRPWLHVGGSAGLAAATDVDAHMGSTATHFGFALSVHAGYRRHLARAWSIGVMGRLTLYGFESDTPAPPASSVGFLPVLLLTFTR
jgi:hypothetical protein